MSDAKLCVILLNHANWRDTLECLESLARLRYRRLVVVVVDTESRHGDEESPAKIDDWVTNARDGRGAPAVWNRFPEGFVARPDSLLRLGPQDCVKTTELSLPLFASRLVLVVAGQSLGFAAGCNLGLRLALRDSEIRHFWLLNNDAVAAPDAATHLVAAAEAASGALGARGTVIAEYDRPDRIQMLGGGRIRAFSAEPSFPAHGAPVAEAATRSAALEELDYISGASLFTNAQTVRAVGLLDETMHLYWEDTDWCARMRQAGRSLGVCAEAVVWHKGHAATGGINAYTKYHSLRSAAVYMRRHRRHWLGPLMTRLTKSVLRDLAHGRPRDAAASARGLVAGLAAARHGVPPQVSEPEGGDRA